MVNELKRAPWACLGCVEEGDEGGLCERVLAAFLFIPVTVAFCMELR